MVYGTVPTPGIATLVQSARDCIVATRSFEVRQPADGKNVSDVVTVFGKAIDMLASEMIGWTLQHGPALQPGNK
jgi:cholesterol transport system auxiliary component